MSDKLQHRKGSVNILFTDESGNPLAGKDIMIRQTGHEFLFGCGAFDVLPLTAPEGGLKVARTLLCTKATELSSKRCSRIE